MAHSNTVYSKSWSVVLNTSVSSYCNPHYVGMRVVGVGAVEAGTVGGATVGTGVEWVMGVVGAGAARAGAGAGGQALRHT